MKSNDVIFEALKALSEAHKESLFDRERPDPNKDTTTTTTTTTTTRERILQALADRVYFNKFPEHLSQTLQSLTGTPNHVSEALIQLGVWIAKLQDDVELNINVKAGEIEGLQKRIDDAHARISILESPKRTLNAQLAGQRDRMNTQDARLDDIEHSVSDLTREVKGHSDRLVDVSIVVSSLEKWRVES